ncbi:hypothetical protein [Acholeplasma hippikon]|uniref:Phospholipid/glycerol acyltransferase domain-containing protein n=1 Tax=Acholeplasma hippikon TaxID=264636 RepID=A0A449BIW6_9MOLU|nr:hypothetical protein [Acholeplasma hippikon]VEU82405.1 Uncharacterised protein [Acholeplasma hippikon]
MNKPTYKELLGLTEKQIKPMDMQMKPKKEKFYLTPIAWALSFLTTKARKLKVNKVNMDGLKPPYLLLCTHHSFDDFKVQTHAIFPNRSTYVIAVDGFIGREGLLRNVGGIPKRKFTPQDLQLYKSIRYSLEKLKRITTIYPEAAYSVIGTTAALPDSLAKMIVNLKYPVVTLNMHGNFLNQPVFMSKRKRKVNLTADLTQVISKADYDSITVEEAKERVTNALAYDEWKYQLDHKIVIDDPDRAEGLEKVLYQCQNCLTEHEMEAKGTKIWCNHCGETHELDVYGQLNNINGKTRFKHVPDWYEQQRAFVRQQLIEGTYHFEDEVYIDSLRNAKGYIKLPDGKLEQTINGIKLIGTDLEGELNVFREAKSLYSIHIEFNYHMRSDKQKADAVVISTLNDTYYCYPKNAKNVITKIRFAVEESYKLMKAKIKE